MNRLFQGTLAFVMTVAVISGVSGKEPNQLTDAESRQVVGELFGQCTPIGPCDSAGLTPPNEGQAGVAVAHACVEGAACRVCDSGSIYRQCEWYWAGSCNGITADCGTEYDGGVCGAVGQCALVSGSIEVEPCRSSNCTGNL